MSTSKPSSRPNIQYQSSASPCPDLPDTLYTSGSPQPGHGVQYRVYRWRWFMLVVISLLNISNGMMWLTFAPIPDFTARYYNVEEDNVDWFSVVYFIVSLLMGLFSIVVLDTWGLKVSLYLGAAFNFTGSLLRWVSTVHPIVCSTVYSQSGFLVAMVGQFLTACAQPFLLYAPTKLAGLWFGPKERAICTNFASVANPLGIAVTQLAAPYIVTSTDRLPMLLWIYAVPAGVGAVLTVVAFWWSRPPTPPAPTAEPDKQNLRAFFRGLIKTLTSWPFWVLLVTWGAGAGLFNAFLTLLPQILCPYGYTDKDAGLWGALMIFLGLVGATIAGLIIDYTKKFKEVAVISLTMAILCLIWFMEVFRLHNQSVNIAFSVCLFGFFALPLIPICMELGVEITYPVAEATSSGLLWSAAQIMGIAIVFLSPVLQVDLTPDLMATNKCASTSNALNSSQPSCFHSNNTGNHEYPVGASIQPKDLSYAVLFYVALETAVYLLFVLVFPPRYRRVEAEAEAKKRATIEQSVLAGTEGKYSGR